MQPEPRDQFPLIAMLYAATVALLLFLVHWLTFVLFTTAILITYFAARYTWGRARVHNWLNNETDEPAPWC